MAGKSRAVEYDVLRWLTGQTGQTLMTGVAGITPWLALFTAAPSDTGGGTEVSTSGTGYARVNTSGMWGTPSGGPGAVANSTLIAMGTATANWGVVTHWGIYDASIGGNLLAWAPTSYFNLNANALTTAYGASAPGTYTDFATGASGNAQVFGLRFTPTENIVATGIRFFRTSAAGVATTHDCRLWTDAGVQLQQITTSGESATHVWVAGTFTGTQALVAGTYYVASVYFPNNDGYVYNWHGFDSAKVIGQLSGPIAAGRSSSLTPGSHVFPTNTGFNNGEYFIDITYARANQGIFLGDVPQFAIGSLVLNED